MVAVSSSMRALESAAPEFVLPDVTEQDRLVTLDTFSGAPLLVMFICNHCPFVVHVMKELAAIANHFKRQGFAVVAISSNDVINYPQDAPEMMHQFARDYNFEFAYLYDETQSVAKAYGAECTPDFFVYDRAHKLRYRGQMDAARPGNGIPVTGDHLRNAMQAVLDGEKVSKTQIPSIGCNIKWKIEN